MISASFGAAAVPGIPCLHSPRREYNSALPTYVFMCGVEGAGHHAMETVWEKLAEHYDIGITTYNPGLHSFAKDPTVSRAYQFSSIKLERHKKRFEVFLKTPGIAGKPILFDTRNSYPEGFGVGSLAHPDLIYLSQLDGVLFNLRVIVMHRDPTATVLSAVRRFKVKEFQYKNYQFQARAVQESLGVINNALASVPCGHTLRLSYEDLLANPQRFVAAIAQVVGVSSAVLATCMGDLQKPKPKVVEGDMVRIQKDLKDFFKAQEHMWPLLTGAQKLPALSVPKVTDGPAGSKPEPKVHSPAMSVHTETPKSSANKYLQVTWFTNLGFNNVRFILEETLYLARLLNRKLMVTPALRMRKCMDEVQCAKTKCTKKDDTYWCPTTMFLKWGSLKVSQAHPYTIAPLIQNCASKRA